jgi:hypothetical protein
VGCSESVGNLKGALYCKDGDSDAGIAFSGEIVGVKLGDGEMGALIGAGGIGRSEGNDTDGLGTGLGVGIGIGGNG